jgi:hypothetical protein
MATTVVKVVAPYVYVFETSRFDVAPISFVNLEAGSVLSSDFAVS